jgi:hypothetical protein
VSDNFALDPAVAFGPGDIRPSWWTQWTSRNDLAAHRNQRRQFIARVLATSPGAVIVGLNVGATFTGYHTPVPALPAGVAAVVLALILFGAMRQTHRLISPATSAAIMALRQMIAPDLWREVAASAASHCQFARSTPITPALIYHWLDRAVDAARGRTAAEIVVAEQAQAFG